MKMNREIKVEELKSKKKIMIQQKIQYLFCLNNLIKFILRYIKEKDININFQNDLATHLNIIDIFIKENNTLISNNDVIKNYHKALNICCNLAYFITDCYLYGINGRDLLNEIKTPIETRNGFDELWILPYFRAVPYTFRKPKPEVQEHINIIVKTDLIILLLSFINKGSDAK